jgi:hypothetical protein
LKSLSKINYLLIVLILLVVGYMITWQLRVATRSACQLLAAEVAEKIEIHVIKAYQKLKRYPDADREFETLVLHELDFARYPARMTLHRFKPGGPALPATFQVRIQAKTTAAIVVELAYYGVEYRENPLYKGKLLRRFWSGYN